jgi:hypothetical protein
MYAKYPHSEPIERAVKLVMLRRLPVRFSTTPWVSRFGIHNFVLVAGRFVGTGSHRGDVQSNGRRFVHKSQVLVYDLDAGRGRQSFETTEG